MFGAFACVFLSTGSSLVTVVMATKGWYSSPVVESQRVLEMVTNGHRHHVCQWGGGGIGVKETVVSLYKSLVSLVHFHLSFSKSLLSAPSLADLTPKKTWATTTLPPCSDRRGETQRGERGCGEVSD